MKLHIISSSAECQTIKDLGQNVSRDHTDPPGVSTVYSLFCEVGVLPKPCIFLRPVSCGVLVFGPRPTVKNKQYIACLFVCRFTVMVLINNFSVILGRFPGLNQYYAMGMKCHAQGHNTAPCVRIEPATLGSKSTTLYQPSYRCTHSILHLSVLT